MKPPHGFPIRFAVCDTATDAHRLVDQLQQEGFTAQEISVVCSQEACEREFAAFVHQHPAGSQTAAALDKAGLGTLGLGAAAVIASVLTSAGTAVAVIGAFSGLAIAGTFAAMMMTRGAEQELADYYDQAITHGKILVAVETDDPQRQHEADQVLHPGGSPPSAIPKESP